ncbi:MAG: DNA methyltransferase [Corynebacterium sp.]|nr:DNA methyltransferase [Corynebacterium sp.]
MIRDNIEKNQQIMANDLAIAKIRRELPEYFDTEGNFMIDRLQNVLAENSVDLNNESYELKFLGKSYSKYIASTKPESVLVPDTVHNGQERNAQSENLYIVGDNLDVLKHLLGSYARKIKCIYIDPPYNTGSDGFIYADKFDYTVDQLVEKIGLSQQEAERILDLKGKSSHSAWLSFMYPRIYLVVWCPNLRPIAC